MYTGIVQGTFKLVALEKKPGCEPPQPIQTVAMLRMARVE